MITRSKKIGDLLSFNVRISLAFALFILVILFIIIYFLCASAYREDLKFFAILIGTSTAIYSAYFVGASLRMQVYHEKQKSSFEILGLLNRPEFVEVRNFLEREVDCHERLSDTDLFNKISTNKELANAVTIVMGILEDMSIAIQYDYVDEDILHCSLSSIVIRNFSGLRGWLEQNRRTIDDEELGIEWQKLVDSWKSGKRLSDGTKF